MIISTKMRLCHFTKSKQMFFSALNPLGNVELIIMHFFAPILKQTVLVQTYIYIHKMTNHFLAHNICHLFHPACLSGTFSPPPAQNTSLISVHQKRCKCPLSSRSVMSDGNVNNYNRAIACVKVFPVYVL